MAAIVVGLLVVGVLLLIIDQVLGNKLPADHALRRIAALSQPRTARSYLRRAVPALMIVLAAGLLLVFLCAIGSHDQGRGRDVLVGLAALVVIEAVLVVVVYAKYRRLRSRTVEPADDGEQHPW